jgi:UDP-N-acetylglucosamine 2-epimerase
MNNDSNFQDLLFFLKYILKRANLNCVLIKDHKFKYKLSKLKVDFYSNVQESDYLNHSDFMKLIYNCEFIVTDSGGLQQEAYILGIPTIIYRETSELDVTARPNIRVIKAIDDALDFFLANYLALKLPVLSIPESPSEIVVKSLVSLFESEKNL